jgi:hypothetical protein
VPISCFHSNALGNLSLRRQQGKLYGAYPLEEQECFSNCLTDADDEEEIASEEEIEENDPLAEKLLEASKVLLIAKN